MTRTLTTVASALAMLVAPIAARADMQCTGSYTPYSYDSHAQYGQKILKLVLRDNQVTLVRSGGNDGTVGFTKEQGGNFSAKFDDKVIIVFKVEGARVIGQLFVPPLIAPYKLETVCAG